MADLYIFIPFSAQQLNTGQDLPKSALEFQNAFDPQVQNGRIGDHIGANITQIHVVYMNSNFNITANDYLIVFAHGSNQVVDRLYSNQPNLNVQVNAVINKLGQSQASTAQKILFMCCFSSQQGHIARLWKAQNQGQTVYGSQDAIANLYSATNSGLIRQCCSALGLI